MAEEFEQAAAELEAKREDERMPARVQAADLCNPRIHAGDVLRELCSVHFALGRAMPEFYDKLEEAAAICRSLAAKVDDRAEAQAMREIVEAIEEIIKLAKDERLFFHE